jgi:hypothetical protein
MSSSSTLPPETVSRVQAILLAEPGALDTLLADPRAFASARLGLDLPEGFAVRREGDRLFYGVGGDLAVAQLDEMSDEVLEAVTGGGSPCKEESLAENQMETHRRR